MTKILIDRAVLKQAQKAIHGLLYDNAMTHERALTVDRLLQAAMTAAPAGTPLSTEFLYEELRKATDGGSESMTHDDALKQIAYWRDRCSQITPAEPVAYLQTQREPCIWTHDPDCGNGDTYESACGEAWVFIDGGPEENRVKFCHGCSKPVEVAMRSEE